MLLEVETIKTAYEVLELTPEQIAEAQGLELTAVKAALMGASSRYRKDVGAERLQPNEDEKNLDFTDEELKTANEIIVEAAKYATLSDGSIDYRTRAENARYIRDDKKGRKNPAKVFGGPQFNLIQFNESIKAAKELKEKIITEIGGGDIQPAWT